MKWDPFYSEPDILDRDVDNPSTIMGDEGMIMGT